MVAFYLGVLTYIYTQVPTSVMISKANIHAYLGVLSYTNMHLHSLHEHQFTPRACISGKTHTCFQALFFSQSQNVHECLVETVIMQT